MIVNTKEKSSSSTSSIGLKPKGSEGLDDPDLVLDSEIDRLLTEKAAKTNLTVLNVKSIIRQIIKNEMVQNVVAHKMRRMEKENCGTVSGKEEVVLSSNEEEDTGFCFEPKLTRAKTKELFQAHDQSRIPLWPMTPVKLLQVKPSPPTETQMLITEKDLPEESEAEDDEYIPQETDFRLSDEDDDASLASLSDVGSPATSAISRSTLTTAARGRRKRDSTSRSPQRNEESVFKTPSPKKTNLSLRHSNAIGLRTRSKLRLNDTPLEDLEKKFIPPDISTDMYEWNESDNEDYLQFLKTCAFSAIPDGNGNDDEEGDPEYNVMEDEEDTHDKEEHRVDRAVKVSKKELNELITELFDGYQLSNHDEVDNLISSITNQSTSNKNGNILREQVETLKTTATTAAGSIKISTSDDSMFPIPLDASKDLTKNRSPVNGLKQLTSTQVDSADMAFYAMHPVPILHAPTAAVSNSSNQVINPDPLFSEEMLNNLRHQMQKHIQLLATTYVCTAGLENYKLTKVAHSAKSLLLEISSTATADSNQPSSVFAGKNLNAALDILKVWPNKQNSSSPIKKKILEEQGFKSPGNKSDPQYERKLARIMVESSAFMYPSLLPQFLLPPPKALFPSLSSNCDPFTLSEDCLIARGLEELKQRNMKLKDIAAIISDVSLPTRTPKQVLNRIKNMKKTQPYSTAPKLLYPLREYLMHGTIPDTPKDAYVPFQALPPVQQPIKLLSRKWSKFIDYFLSNTVLEHTLSPKTFDLVQEQLSKRQRKQRKSLKTTNQEETKAGENTDSPNKSESSFFLNSSSVTPSDPDYKVFTIKNDSGDVQFYYAIPTFVIQKTDDVRAPLSLENDEGNDVNTISKIDSTSPNRASDVIDLNPTESEENAESLMSDFVEAVDGAENQTTATETDSNKAGTENNEGNRESNSQTNSLKPSTTGEQIGYGRGEDDDEDKDKDKKRFMYKKEIVDDQIEENTEENTEATDEESPVDQIQSKIEKERSSLSSPEHRGSDATTHKTPTSKKRKKTLSGSAGNSVNVSPRSSGSGKRHKYNTTPVEQLLDSTTPEDDEVVDAFSEAFLVSVRQRLETKNPSLYAAFLQLLNDSAMNGTSDEELCLNMELLLKDYPDLVKEFGGLQTAEVAFATGNFIQYKETHAQIHFLQLLEKWTINCPQLKTKIIQRLKSLQDAKLTEAKVVDVMQPLFSQIQNPLILDAFKALFPSIFRPQTNMSDTDYEDVDLDVEDGTKHEVHGQPELEFDTYEHVKLPEEKQVIATNTCPCDCHNDPINLHYQTRVRHCNKCCIRFQDGKLFLHSGRVMKPVSIDFHSPERSKQIFVAATIPPTSSSVTGAGHTPLKTTRPSSSPVASTSSTSARKQSS